MCPLKGTNMYPDMELALKNADLTCPSINKKRGDGVALSRFRKKKQKLFSLAAKQELIKAAKRYGEFLKGNDVKVEENPAKRIGLATPDQSSEKFDIDKFFENKDAKKPIKMFKYKHAYQKSIEEQIKSIMGNLSIPQNEEAAAAKPVPDQPAPTAPAPAGAGEKQLLEKIKKKKVEFKPLTTETIKELFKINEAVPNCDYLPSPCDLHTLMRNAPDRLELGNDILITIKAFQPCVYEEIIEEPDPHRLTYNVFNHTIVLTGRNTVSDIMDHFLCHTWGCNDVIRCNEKETRSGFVFMDKAFYIENGDKAAAHEQAVEEWRTKRNFDDYPKLDMRTTKLADLDFTLGSYNLYVHNSTCEHILQVTEIRVVGMDDPNYLSDYPRTSALALSYRRSFCSECKVYDPIWVVEDHPYQPGELVYYCGPCLRRLLNIQQMYKKSITCKIRPNMPNMQPTE